MLCALIFCGKCGSCVVDVRGWKTPTCAIIYCGTCGHEATIEGFSLGRVVTTPSEQPMRAAMAEAVTDCATYSRNHRERGEFLLRVLHQAVKMLAVTGDSEAVDLLPEVEERIAAL